MKLLRRLALVISMLVCGSVTFTVASIVTDAHIAGHGLAAQGQGGGGPLPAGNYHFTTFRADYSLSAGPPAFQTISLNINGSTQRSNPLVGPSTFTSETDVSFNIFDGSTYEQGCFILSSPSDFTLSSDVLSASLHTTITSATAPCADAFNITPLPLTIDVTWTGGSALLTSRSDKRYDCLTYSSVTQDANLSSNTNATATISPIFTRSFATTTAGLGTDDQRTQAAGALEAACSGPNGKGAGPGPQPAGNTQITTLIAGMAGSASDGSQINLDVNRGTTVSHPIGSPSTTTSETDLFIESTGGPVFAFECFVIPAADFTQSGVQSASLNTTVTSTTPTCGFFHVPPPLPLTISATWTGTSPVVTQSSEGTASCMTFSTESTGSTTTNGATGTATLSPLFPDTITGRFGDMINADVTIHTQGVDPDPCIFRN